MKFIIIAFICSFLLTGCKEKIYEVTSSEVINIKNDIVNVYDEVYLNDLLDIKNNDIELLNENYQLDTNNIGDNTYNILYKYDNKTYSYNINIKVIDNEAPVVFSGTNKTVTRGYNDDLCNLITYGDNYDGNINCLIEGNYDLNKIGTYKLNYKLSDSSNNTKEVNVTLNVVEKTNSNNTTVDTKKTYFNDIINKYKNDDNEVGIDVSKWQGNIDFQKVKEAGATFVMMRIGVQKKTKGDLEIDQYYYQNIKNAKEAGLKVGVYLYSIATSSEEAIEHANWVIKTLDGEKLDLPIVFDWENWSKWNTYKISFHEINSIANNYMTTVKNAGYEGMLYSSKFYLEKIWTNKLNFPIWLAHYTSKTSYTGQYKIWQLCNNGRIDGINGDVDIDILYN